MESGARLKATDARNLPKPVKVALRTRDKVAQTQEELLKWTKNLNPGLHTEHWRILIINLSHRARHLYFLYTGTPFQLLRGLDTRS
jgi:hypothetical protein